ncbi:11759_t:CDS:2 [Rhizophagus irregularis]|nr:11759_t:CDS:2 [Rhizophagus irregularis]
MSNITLSCLIQGTSLDKYFKITIDKNNDISDLKDIVWNKNKTTFSNIDANNLILWKVKIPISDKAKFKQLDFTESTIEGDLGGTKINDASDEIKDVFGNSPVRKHIHIIIGQPTIVQLTTTTRALNQETQSLANEYNGRSLFSDNLFSNRETSDISKNDQPDKKNSREYITNTRSRQSSHNNSLRSEFRQGLNYDETNIFGLSLYNQNKQNSGINNRTGFNLSGQSPCTCKILLLGGTGTGKSTIINMMANYFLDGTLENPKVVIPTKYFEVTENAFGRNDTEAKVGDVTRSQTTKCCNYEFKHPENPSCNFVFIDTPGMSDTNGIEQDDKNIQEIINTAIDAGSLTAIIIIASGTEARVTPTIKNTLTRLANNLPDEIVSNNLLLILTKCTKSSASFSEDVFAKEIAKPKKIFYMDNQIFCADPQIWLNDEDEYSTVKHQWDKSFKTFSNLLKIITEMNATSTEAFTTMRELRNKIKSEIVTISQTTTNIQQVQDKLEAAYKALRKTGDQKNSFANYTTTEEITIKKPIQKDTKDTLCTTHMRDGTICHENCQLEVNFESGSSHFIRCSCMGQDGKCRICGHYHDNTEMVTETKTIEKVLEDIKAQYDMADKTHKKISNYAHQFQETFANLQDQANANYDRIFQLCTDLSKICSRFNFVNELHANIENMRMDARNIQSIDLRKNAESDIRKLETFINGLSNRINK